MTVEKLDAILLAGGKIDPELQKAAGVDNRALIPLGSRTMLERVTDALHESVRIGSIYIVGDMPPQPGCTAVKPEGDLYANLQAGIAAARKANPSLKRVLTVTADIPFLSAGAVDDFVANGSAGGAHLCYPIVPMDAYNRIFGAMKRTTLKLRDGHFTGGNIMLLDAHLMTDKADRIRDAYAARKNVFRLGAMLGPGLLFKILISQAIAPGALSVAELEAGVSRLLGDNYRAAAVVTQYPEIGTDVDKLEDVEFARRWFADRDRLDAAAASGAGGGEGHAPQNAKLEQGEADEHGAHHPRGGRSVPKLQVEKRIVEDLES